MNTRRIHAGAVIVVATFALAAVSACGSNNEPENVSATLTPAAAPTSATMSTPSNDVTTPAESPSPETQPTAAAPAPHAQADDEGATSPASTPQRQLPTTAGDYSEAFMQAWTGGDKAAMASYATPAVVEQMSDVKPEGALLRTVCEDNMCSYSEENGGRVTLTLDLAKVDSGADKGITSVKLDL